MAKNKDTHTYRHTDTRTHTRAHTHTHALTKKIILEGYRVLIKSPKYVFEV